MARAVGVTELLTRRRRVVKLEGIWEDVLGSPELRGAWIIWGNSTNGKTVFALQLCKYLSRFGKVLYNSLEEADGDSMRRAFESVRMGEVRGRVTLLTGEPVDELTERLLLPRSPSIVVIDSLQYFDISYRQYRELKEKFRGKLFIFVSHARGREPKGTVAEKIRYDAGIKIYVEGYVAYAAGRYGGGRPYEIWPEKVREL